MTTYFLLTRLNMTCRIVGGHTREEGYEHPYRVDLKIGDIQNRFELHPAWSDRLEDIHAWVDKLSEVPDPYHFALEKNGLDPGVLEPFGVPPHITPRLMAEALTRHEKLILSNEHIEIEATVDIVSLSNGAQFIELEFELHHGDPLHYEQFMDEILKSSLAMANYPELTEAKSQRVFHLLGLFL